MHWPVALVLLGFASLTAAHDGPAPKLLGGRKLLSQLQSKTLLDRRALKRRMPHILEDMPKIERRATNASNDNKSGKCGPGRGTCAAGYCCSVEGWCGSGIDYCEAPDCQLTYGPGCDGNQKPSGVDTSTIPRTRVGSVEYGGVGIYDCVNEGDIALTFDDGPWNYTSDLLDKLKGYGAKATFFIAGNNIGKGMINDPNLPWKAVIQRMAAEGHQIASHTWSHQNFSDITSTQAQNQIIWNEIALNDILGYIPTYMRPPFSICEAACESLLLKLGYHIIYFDLDTEGYLYDDPSDIQISKDIWDSTIDNSDSCDDSFLQIEHDIHWQSVYNLTDYFLTSLFNNGYRSVTVGECLGDPPANWYRAGSSPVPTYDFPVRSATGPLECLKTSVSVTSKRTTAGQSADTTTGDGPSPTGGLTVSTDGSCGSGITCLGSTFGNCCSQYGYCGNTTDYCGDGCQPAFGSDCSSSSSSSTRQPTSATTSTPTTSSSSSTSSTTVSSTIITKTTSSTASSTSSSASSSTSKLTSTSTSSTKSSTSSTSRSTSTSTSRSTSTSKTTSATPTPTALVASKDGSCGPGTGYTCQGSDFGLCCTSSNRCALLCLLTGCQPDYGTCAVLIGPGDVATA